MFTLNYPTASLRTDNFNEAYPALHRHVVQYGSRQESRNGPVVEILDFKTTIVKPNERCVGGYNRNINIFFLLAEAIWIWTGRRDLKFLEIFNSQMKNYSDDGLHFHAAYGRRLRHFNSREDVDGGIDQFKRVLPMLKRNPEDRRVVMQIWNAESDLGKESKDLPCNDLVMLKIRGGKLFTTIANRSNDLDWGLATNVFQFSFVSELLAATLGVEIGGQTHNSQSLHLYLDNPLTMQLEDSYDAKKFEYTSLYGRAKAIPIDFNFSSDDPLDRLERIDWWLKSMITTLLSPKVGNVRVSTTEAEYTQFKRGLFDFSKYFFFVFCLLDTYIMYKDKKASRSLALIMIDELAKDMPEFSTSDIFILACNFFAARMTTEDDKTLLSMMKRERISLTDIGSY